MNVERVAHFNRANYGILVGRLRDVIIEGFLIRPTQFINAVFHEFFPAHLYYSDLRSPLFRMNLRLCLYQ